MTAIAPAILPVVTEAIRLLAEFEPEISLALDALITHRVEREKFNAAIRDLIVKQGEARMKALFPNEEG